MSMRCKLLSTSYWYRTYSHRGDSNDANIVCNVIQRIYEAEGKKSTFFAKKKDIFFQNVQTEGLNGFDLFEISFAVSFWMSRCGLKNLIEKYWKILVEKVFRKFSEKYFLGKSKIPKIYHNWRPRWINLDNCQIREFQHVCPGRSRRVA